MGEFDSITLNLDIDLTFSKKELFLILTLKQFLYLLMIVYFVNIHNNHKIYNHNLYNSKSFESCL
jgi:hypothetical protein